MAKIYHCPKCGRHIIAPSMKDVLNNVHSHNIQKHDLSEHSPT